MKEWVKMPSLWIRSEGDPKLASLRWIGHQKSNQIAALMIYIVLVHHANDTATGEFDDVGYTRITYNQISEITGLSRAKIAGGLQVLKELEVIKMRIEGRNNLYRIVDYGQKSGWAKLPARGLYTKDLKRISAFHSFNLRSKVELNALKAYLLIVALRSNNTNYAIVSYEKIVDYTGIVRNDVKSALSLLVTHGLIHVEQVISEINKYSTVNVYRPCHLETYKHRGTTGRRITELLN